MSPNAGRPRSQNPKSERLYIRVTPNEKSEIQDFSKRNNIGLLELIREGMEAVKSRK